MLDLRFTTRSGDEKHFDRGLTVDDGTGERDFCLSMRSTATGRVGTIRRAIRRPTLDGKKILDPVGAPVWEGLLPDGPPPTRAFALAAGLCDENGGTDLPLPEWAEED